MPSAHSLGFNRGGLLRLQEEYMGLRRNALKGANATASTNNEDMERMESLGIEIDKRKDIVLAQCTAALISSFIATAETYRPSTNTNSNHSVANNWWNSTVRAGFLLHMEGVMNNSKKDQCRILDRRNKCEWLETLRSHCCFADHPLTKYIFSLPALVQRTRILTLLRNRPTRHASEQTLWLNICMYSCRDSSLYICIYQNFKFLK